MARLEAINIVDDVLRQLDDVGVSSSSIDEAYERLERWKRRAVAALRLISPTEARALERKRNAYAITDSFEPFEKEVSILRTFLGGFREEIILNGDRPMMREERDTAQLCVAGHWTNSRVRDMPDLNKAFCDLCGSKTISTCPKCSGPIPGGFPGIVSLGKGGTDAAPKFCVHCGSAYPWTQLALQTALDISDEAAGLSSQQREEAQIEYSGSCPRVAKNPTGDNPLQETDRIRRQCHRGCCEKNIG